MPETKKRRRPLRTATPEALAKALLRPIDPPQPPKPQAEK